MKVIAKTDQGFLIEGTTYEVESILDSVQGPIEEVSIGQKIPAIDYAATIRRFSKLSEEYNYKELMSRANRFLDILHGLKEAVENAANLGKED